MDNYFLGKFKTSIAKYTSGSAITTILLANETRFLRLKLNVLPVYSPFEKAA